MSNEEPLRDSVEALRDIAAALKDGHEIVLNPVFLRRVADEIERLRQQVKDKAL